MEKIEQPVKIFIRDILTLERLADDPNYYIFQNRLIRRVDVMGIITEVRRLENKHLYKVDDGTGTITCSFDHNSRNIMNDFREIEDLQKLVAEHNLENESAGGLAMECLLEETFKKQKRIMSSLEQGDCAHLQGFINSFFDNLEIDAFTLYKVFSAEEEVDRVFEMSALYAKS